MVAGVSLSADSGLFAPVLTGKAKGTAAGNGTTGNGQTAGNGQAESTGASKNGATDTLQLSPEAQQVVARLQRTDAAVRAHEAAHQAAGGAQAGGASFQFQKGPDGKNYAVGGEVPIDISRESSPDATINKMETVKAAALAPADPSGQDRAVAAQADGIKAQAQAEKNKQQNGEGGSGADGDSAQVSTGNPTAQKATRAYSNAARIGGGGQGGNGQFAFSA